MSDGVVVAASDGRIVQMNQAARQIFGLLPQAPLPPGIDALRGSIEAYHPDGRPLPLHEIPLVRALRGEPVQRQEIVIAAQDVARRTLLVGCGVVREPSGTVSLGVVVLTDISERRLLEQRREEFLRIVAHDVRQPLSAITLTCEVLQHQSPPEVRELVTRLNKNARQIDAIVSDLVDAARLEAPSLRLQRQPLDLGQLTAEVLQRTLDAPEAERVQLSCELTPQVAGDASWLERALVNLVQNALKYSSPGLPVGVSVGAAADEVRVSVADQGPGIGPDQLPRIFERYYRSDQEPGKEGLGLYITRLIVEAHGGTIAVQSTLGQGSTRVPTAIAGKSWDGF